MHSENITQVKPPTPPPRSTSRQIDFTKYVRQQSPTSSEYSRIFENIVDTTTNSSDVDVDHDSVFAETMVFNDSAPVLQCTTSTVLSTAPGYYHHDSQQHKQSSTPHANSNALSDETTAAEVATLVVELGSGNNNNNMDAGLVQASAFDVRAAVTGRGCDERLSSSTIGGVNMGNICRHQQQQFGQNHKQDSGNYLDYSNENVNEYDDNYFETIMQQHEYEYPHQQQQAQYQELENQLFRSFFYNERHEQRQQDTIIPHQFNPQHPTSTENSALIDNSCNSGNELQIPRDYQPSFLDIVSNPGQVDYNDQQRLLRPPCCHPPNNNHHHEDNSGYSGFDETTESSWWQAMPPKAPITPATTIAERPYSMCVAADCVGVELNDSNSKTKIDLTTSSGGDHDKNNRTQSETLKITHKLKGELARLTVVATLFVVMFIV